MTTQVLDRPRILVLGGNGEHVGPLVEHFGSDVDVVVPDTLENGLTLLRTEKVSGVFFAGGDALAAGSLLEAGGILEQMPDGFALLDSELSVLWSNTRFCALAGCDEPPIGRGFYDAFGSPEILGPDFCPLHTALGTGEPARSTLRVGDKTYFEVHVNPVFEDEDDLPDYLVVLVRDVSIEVLQRQKLNAIYQAGLELGDLSPLEIFEMSVEDRIELLKSKILHFTQDLLEFETVEIRLLDRHTRKLEPLLSVGMQPVAAGRELYAEANNNGVTGFVAATGKSYLCEDTTSDPLYLPGAEGASSSLTVPLVLHDEILGTFNVESPTPGAFNEHDLQFLEIFSREVAVALNTLELLAAEKMTTAAESTDLMLRQVTGPVDEILNDAAWILEKYIGHEPAVCERLQRILRHTRNIKQVIQRVGEEIKPGAMHSPLPPRPHRPRLRGKRILVVDEDNSVRQAAHELLGRNGCEVETAHHGEEACLMLRRFDYDAALVDIRLPDMDGYECFCRLRQIQQDLPVVLMTGFGYDPTHSIVKARQDGCKSVLYKPFRLDQLFAELEKAVDPEAAVDEEADG